MTFIKQVLLLFMGLCGGGIVAAGVFAFITILGLVPRLAARTHTASQVMRYENWIVLGAVFGNVVDLFDMPLAVGPVLGWIFLTVWGVASGIFIGCLVMSLAETLDTVPTINRRIRLAVGIQYVIAGIGLGKMVGSLVYFLYNISA